MREREQPLWGGCGGRGSRPVGVSSCCEEMWGRGKRVQNRERFWDVLRGEPPAWLGTVCWRRLPA
ncbi:hypothetical protein FKM82_028674 [Ascaphus truei]